MTYSSAFNRPVSAVVAVFLALAVTSSCEEFTVVVDPGHGGLDSGVVSSLGAKEKDVALEYAKTFAERAASDPNLNVLLTRQGDEALGPDRPASIANQAKADVFISFHVDAMASATLSGVKLWMLKIASPEKTRRRPSTRPIPWENVQLGFLKKTRRLAEAIMGEWERVDEEAPGEIPPELWEGSLDPKVGRAPFRVLRGVAAPAVVVSVGYFSDEYDEQWIQDPAWKASIIDALLRGIRRFLEVEGP